MFEHLGYFKNYYFNNKLVGDEILKEKDREILGYYGRKEEVLQENRKFKKITLKKGTKIITELNPLMGKVLPEFKEKLFSNFKTNKKK